MMKIIKVNKVLKIEGEFFLVESQCPFGFYLKNEYSTTTFISTGEFSKVEDVISLLEYRRTTEKSKF